MQSVLFKKKSCQSLYLISFLSKAQDTHDTLNGELIVRKLPVEQAQQNGHEERSCHRSLEQDLASPVSK